MVLIFSGIAFAIFWSFWHKTPTCFDKLKNGDESGVDCGGSCVLVCSDNVINPIIRWDPRMFEVMSGIWSVVVYVENPNTNVDATYAPYSFTIYDENNKVLEKRESATILPKNKTTAIFEGGMKFSNDARPKRAVFELDKNIVWKKNNEDAPELKITHGSLLNLDTAPRVEASVTNENSKEIKNIELVITIFDGMDNVIAASRTFVESLVKNENQNVFFTWPKPFELGTKACEKSSDVMLLLDRSGSMVSLGENPPEPLTTAKAAAVSFVGQLKPNDKIGVISFATNAKEPIDLSLTSDFALAKDIIQSVEIEATSTQYTNVFSALNSSWQELISPRADEGFSKIVVLLTDGMATNPVDPQGKSEADNIKYAEDAALKEAIKVKDAGVTIYTIGLGDKINESFLENVASTKEDYFFAPSAANLLTIYKNISTDICNEVPARIEITYKIFGNLI